MPNKDDDLRLHLTAVQAELIASVLQETPIPGKYAAAVADILDKINHALGRRVDESVEQ